VLARPEAVCEAGARSGFDPQEAGDATSAANFRREKEAKLIALACSSAPPGHARWTLRLLEDQVVEREIVDRASDNTIGRVLKKTNLNLIAKSNGSSRRSKTALS